MNELEALKKQLKEILNIIERAVRTRFEKIVAEFQTGQDKARRSRILIAFGLSLVFFGSFLVSAISRGKIHVPGFLGPLGLETLLNRSVRGLNVDKDGNLILCSFERKEDLSLWNKNSVSISISKDHVVEGSQSGLIVMQGGKAWAGLTLEEFFVNNNRVSDWSDYQALQFYMFNPGKESERLLVQIKDQWNRKFKSEFVIQPGQGADVSLPVKTISASINVRKIDQVNIFRWNPKDTKEFYLDNLRLVRASRTEKIMGKVAAIHAPEKKKITTNPVDYGFKQKKKAWQLQPSDVAGDVVRIPFIITNETDAPCVLCPAEGSIPLPMGEVTEEGHVRLRNGQDMDIPFQPRTLARWPDGSIKWLAPQFLATLAPTESRGLYLDYGPNVRPLAFKTQMDVRNRGGAITIMTGKMRVIFSKKAFFLFDQVAFDQNDNGTLEPEEVVVSKAPLFITSKNKEFRAELDKKTYEIDVEEEGPVRTVVRASGWFQAQDGQKFCQVILRYYFYEGQNYVKVSHTFIYTGFPANTAFRGYQNLKLPENETISSLGMRLPLSFTEPLQTHVSYGAQAPELVELVESNQIRLLQSAWKKAEIKTDASNIPASDYFSSWLDISDSQHGVTVAVRDFRENFPKAMGINRTNGELQIDLWPAEAGELNLATTPEALGPRDEARGSAFGLGKTHELLFYFHEKEAVPSHASEYAYSFAKRMVIRNNPYWVEAAGILGRLLPVSDKYTSQEKMVERIFDWATRFPKMFGWYGMLYYGDTLTWFRIEDKAKKYDEPGWHPEGRWGWFHTEGVGLASGALLQFVRSGLWKYFELGEASARHAMDIQTIHYNTVENDSRLKSELDKKMSQVGSMHRHGAMPWSGRSDDATHTHVMGILLYYYLSGDERAMDVAREIGEYLLQKPFTNSNHWDEASQRSMANALWSEVLLYDATGDERYKKEADQIAEIYVKGQQADGSYLQTYHPKSRTWTGKKNRAMMENHVIGALIAYHELTQDEKVKDAILKLVNYCSANPASASNSLRGVAYAYWLTHDKHYLAVGEKSLQWLIRNQHSPRDPILSGMIYDRPAYFRPVQLLSSVPYIFSALEDGFQEALEQ